MNRAVMETIQMRNAECGVQKSKRGGGQAKLIEAERAVEGENVRVCSPMFAYVRLTGKKLLRARPLWAVQNWGRERKAEGRMQNAE
jgi:hypothetical protein